MDKTIRELIQEPCGVITAKRQLAPLIYELTVYAPAIVHNAEPGQFVIVYARDGRSKPIPLTIADFDKQAGTITLVIQAVKVGTIKLLTMNAGETFFALQGPAGHASEIESFRGAIVVVAGGVGIAPVYPVIRALKEAGNEVEAILGAREEKFLFWEEKIREYSDSVTVCIEKPPFKKGREEGLVTPSLEKAFLARRPISHVFAAGPLPMLRALSAITKNRGVKNVSSAVAQMIDGTGMCAGCKCNVGTESVLLCQKGPEIDGNLADWENLGVRLNGYRKQEDEALEIFKANDPLYKVFLEQEEAFAKGGVQ